MYDNASRVFEVSIDEILPNRFQPRIQFDEEEILELSDSIKEHGIIQPIVVRTIGDKYEIIAGERRYKASVLAGKETVPVIVKNLNDKDSAEIALIENVQRKNLTPIEEALSYKKILDMGYLTQESLASKLGKSQSSVANKIRLLNLSDEVQEALLENKISERHARSLLKLRTTKEQNNMLDRIIKERLTVRRTDEEITKLINNEESSEGNNDSQKVIERGEINMNNNIFGTQNAPEQSTSNFDIFTTSNQPTQSFDIFTTGNQQESMNNIPTPMMDTQAPVMPAPMMDTQAPVMPAPMMDTQTPVMPTPMMDTQTPVMPTSMMDTQTSVMSTPMMDTQTPVMPTPMMDTQTPVMPAPMMDTQAPVMPAPMMDTQTPVMPAPMMDTQTPVMPAPMMDTQTPVMPAPMMDTQAPVMPAPIMDTQAPVMPAPIMDTQTPAMDNTNTPMFDFNIPMPSQNIEIKQDESINKIPQTAPIIETPNIESQMTQQSENLFSFGETTQPQTVEPEFKMPEPIIVTDYSKQYDPVMPQQNVEVTPKVEFKEVINAIRECSDKIEKYGFKIDVEEYDLSNLYQVIFKIEK